MTIWSPRLPKTDAPIYRRIADALERDVTGGVLLAGGRLPAVRELATRLGVTPVTVSRAYAEAAERGLIETNVGRGTFVRETFNAMLVAPESDEIDLTTNEIPVGAFPDVPPERIAAALATGYRTGAGSDRHRSAGAAWIGGDASPSRVIVTTGTQQALSIAFSTLLKPGDTLLTDPLIYAGIKAIAAHQHLRLEPLATDRYGILPDALERAARNRVSRVVYLTPTLQNPTGVVMPEKRRRDLAAIAEKHGLTIVEDDVYGFLHPIAPAPIRTHAPERTVFVTGVGKALTPALRIGYMLAPDALVPRLATALFASSMFASAVTAEIATLWIEDGTATRIAKLKRETIAMRRRVADRVVGELTSSDAHSAHLWVELPKRWTSDAFAEEARRRRVRVCSASVFAVDPNAAPRHIRVSLGAAQSAAELEAALRVLVSIDRAAEVETIV